MHRKSLARIAGLDVGRSLDGLTEAPQGIRKVVGAAACEGIL
jgi:hypothetical protein